MIESASTLDVDLPELNKLKQKQKQTTWLLEVNELLEDGESFTNLKEYMETGMELPPHPAVERALGEISGLMMQVSCWSAAKCSLELICLPRYEATQEYRFINELLNLIVSRRNPFAHYANNGEGRADS